MSSTSPSTTYFDAAFKSHPVMAIFRGLPPDDTVQMCTAVWDAGIEVVEIPVQSPDAIPSLEAAISAGRARGHDVGAGTVTNVAQLRDVLDRGAAFTVAPGLSPEVSRASHLAGMPHLPGVATATEIGEALELGHTWQKAFPAAELGPSWIKAQLAPFPAVRFVATGGMDQTNASVFIEAGCPVVAVGSALADPAVVDVLAAL